MVGLIGGFWWISSTVETRLPPTRAEILMAPRYDWLIQMHFTLKLLRAMGIFQTK